MHPGGPQGVIFGLQLVPVPHLVSTRVPGSRCFESPTPHLPSPAWPHFSLGHEYGWPLWLPLCACNGACP